MAILRVLYKSGARSEFDLCDKQSSSGLGLILGEDQDSVVTAVRLYTSEGAEWYIDLREVAEMVLDDPDPAYALTSEGRRLIGGAGSGDGR